MGKKHYHVYVLIKDSKPVYVGCSVNVKNRISCHKKTKDFSHYIIIESFNNKKEAFAAERMLIKYNSIFHNNTNIVNRPYVRYIPNFIVFKPVLN